LASLFTNPPQKLHIAETYLIVTGTHATRGCIRSDGFVVVAREGIQDTVGYCAFSGGALLEFFVLPHYEFDKAAVEVRACLAVQRHVYL
jgi:hypothetical protein